VELSIFLIAIHSGEIGGVKMLADRGFARQMMIQAAGRLSPVGREFRLWEKSRLEALLVL